jgi:hypothetical protein
LPRALRHAAIGALRLLWRALLDALRLSLRGGLGSLRLSLRPALRPLRLSLPAWLGSLRLLRRAKLDALSGALLRGAAVPLLRLSRRRGGGKGGNPDRHGKRRDRAIAQESCN